jgi:hypothetical protein
LRQPNDININAPVTANPGQEDGIRKRGGGDRKQSDVLIAVSHGSIQAAEGNAEPPPLPPRCPTTGPILCLHHFLTCNWKKNWCCCHCQLRINPSCQCQCRTPRLPPRTPTTGPILCFHHFFTCNRAAGAGETTSLGCIELLHSFLCFHFASYFNRLCT